ncbi:MAG: ABC transporter permease [Acetobacteraceae bacterium]|nr:ABC transporter permease [Acetobacteraceae bacterium]
MLSFVIRRAILALLVCMTVLVISFSLTRVAGDPAMAVAGPQASAADIAAIRKNYGLDRPLPEQFFNWVLAASRGDLGRSYLYREPVANLIRARLPVTLTLGLIGILFAVAVAIPLGVIAAVNEGTLLDRLVMLVALLGQAMPSFWLALLLIIEFGLRLQWLPIAGLDDWTGYILPSLVLSFSAIPALMRLTRSGMVDALRSDYIRTARAGGLSRASIITKHALRNAAMPVVAIAAVQLGFMLGGSIVTESVFNLPGVGYLAWESISKNDFPVVQAVVLLLAMIYIGLTLTADLLNAVLDPRLRTA